MDDSFNYPRGGRQRMSRDRYSISSDLFPTIFCEIVNICCECSFWHVDIPLNCLAGGTHNTTKWTGKQAQADLASMPLTVCEYCQNLYMWVLLDPNYWN